VPAAEHPAPRSDEELQALRVGKLVPHDAPITLVDYDPGWRPSSSAKRRLAGRRWRHVQHYADAKTSVIEEIMGRADAGGQPRGPGD
jgi:GrpB-like predicted nucleotidyltransferase (UPF0157 family)